ncbi:conserved hypothetical protein [Methylobacterium sp. 4-46]|uniref:DUF6489 family protein n=1 Tax=Methylobacterium sp. (strain 4-46) TaxID=426117 RepID=UPI000152C4C9|nr:DUF6489 family protein [Methylobacterium sp. 4-46]ACA18644.1 conserved hypothetical protein [Methylobacterium sp. 4-46]
MLIDANVDCTPEEARVFLGLPDLQPLQAAVMAKMQERMLQEMHRYSPDRLMKAWMSAMTEPARRRSGPLQHKSHPSSQ